MKITRITPLPVQPRWVFVRLETDEGLVGYGECQGDKPLLAAEAVRSYEHALLGEDPRRVVHHWQSMYRGAFWRGGPILTAALSGLEMALWDLLGKSLGVPVYQLLGGAVRDRIRVYARPYGASPEELAKSAREVVAQGYTALKFCPLDRLHLLDSCTVIDRAVRQVEAVRDAVGFGVDLMLDFHGLPSPAVAALLEEALRPCRPLFIEEPILPENPAALAQLAPQFKTPIATGERLYTRWGFRELLEKGAVAVIQPDPCVCGGIFETRQIAGMAETYYVALAPHNASGPVNLAAALQVAACTPNFLIQEFIGEAALGQGGYLVEPFRVEAGYLPLPKGPGLGVELDEAFLESIPATPLPDVGRWFHEDDGSVADW